MAEAKDKWIDAIAKLIKLTQEGKLKWSSAAPPRYLKQDVDDFVRIVFLTTYKGRNLQLYKRKYLVEFDPITSAAMISYTRIGMMDTKPYWRSEIHLEITDVEGNALWSFPYVDLLGDLLKAVGYQAADVKGFLTDLMREGVESDS